jgi:hypothetical protein
VGGLLVWRFRAPPPAAPFGLPTPPKPASQPAPISPAARPAEGQQVADRSIADTASLARGEAALALLDAISEPASAVPYLDHPSAEVREAALNALLRMGDASAAAPLRAAAARRATPAETAAYNEAAAWLELPPMGTHRKERAAARGSSSSGT